MGLGSAQLIGLVLGPCLGLLMLLLGAPEGLTFAAWATAALVVWMAVWWATEAIPIPATSLLPLAVLPIVGAGTSSEAAAGYSSPIVLLLLGGFVVALGIERWGLHKRIALGVVATFGGGQRGLILGFMVATAGLSMWISNTATTLMMMPIALSAAAALDEENQSFALALLLGVCYAASIGGVATPIGTPTNLIAIDWLEQNVDATIGYVQWMAFGVPAMLLLIPVAWWSVTVGLKARTDADGAVAEVRRQRADLGLITAPEARVAIVFGIVAFLWVVRVPIQSWAAAEDIVWVSSVSDMGIAIAGAITMFLVPAGGKTNRMLLTWPEAVKLPWGVLILFGGGISLGRAITRTELSAWIGEQLSILSVVPPIVFVVAVVALVIFLTELTSNVATMTTLAPILGTLAISVGVAPASLLGPAAVAASCAFMLPVATAPNAIIYATDKVPVAAMMRAGFRVNVVGAAIIAAVGYYIAPLVLAASA
ncbi:MAG: SLC13 family permease [Pseudomonadota bacterium]